MKATEAELLRQLPGEISDEWPMGERFIRALAQGSMSVEIYACGPRDAEGEAGLQ